MLFICILYLDTKGRHQKKNCRFGETFIIYLTPLPPYLKSEKQKNEILVCLRPPLPPAKSDKFAYCYHQRPQLLINFKQENIIPKYAR